MVANDGNILNTITGSATWVDDELINSSNILEDYQLFQNYLNPFNPSTTIEFFLPTSEFVELKVYNLLGREVATLISNKLNQGTTLSHSTERIWRVESTTIN